MRGEKPIWGSNTYIKGCNKRQGREFHNNKEFNKGRRYNICKLMHPTMNISIHKANINRYEKRD